MHFQWSCHLILVMGLSGWVEGNDGGGEDPFASELVKVNWVEELFEGGITMVALGVLSVALGAFLVERFLTLRKEKFVPEGLMKKAKVLFREGKYEEVSVLCENQPSVAAEIVQHCVDYRHSGFELVQAGAADMGARVVLEEEEKCQRLNVIAGVAPLLGLLGTMIGMIESFKLVEVFGDEGGASLLAGSISKALITTAVGLILAIPAVLGFFWARWRVHQIGKLIEVEVEGFLKAGFLSPAKREGE